MAKFYSNRCPLELSRQTRHRNHTRRLVQIKALFLINQMNDAVD